MPAVEAMADPVTPARTPGRPLRPAVRALLVLFLVAVLLAVLAYLLVCPLCIDDTVQVAGPAAGEVGLLVDGRRCGGLLFDEPVIAPQPAASVGCFAATAPNGAAIAFARGWGVSPPAPARFS